MKMIRNCAWYLLLLIIFSCSDEEDFVQQSDGTFMSVAQVNDSVIKRDVLNSERKLSSVEYENTRSNVIKIYYYDENGKLYQSLIFNTSKSDLFDNYIYYDNGKVAEKIVKNAKGDKLSLFEYYENGKLKQKAYFRVGYPVKIAYVAYTKHGDVDLSHSNSHFFRLQKIRHWLYLKPIGIESKVFKDAFMNLVDEFDDDEKALDKQFIFESDSMLKIDLRRFSDLKSLKSNIYIRESDVDGYPSYDKFEIHIENLDSIPKNNLYPIL